MRKLVIMFTHIKGYKHIYHNNKYNFLVDYDTIGCEAMYKYIQKLIFLMRKNKLKQKYNSIVVMYF
jgi:hypothetical protein